MRVTLPSRTRLAASDQQQVVIASQARECLLEHRDVLLLREASRENHQPRADRQLELRAQVATAPRGREDFRVDAERMAGRVTHADGVQVLHHVAAGREHLRAAFVSELHVVLDELPRRAAEAPLRELREVRVIERDQRNAASIRDARGGPRRMECVADLDEIRLERVDGARPAQRVQRQAIVERAGHESAGDGGDVAGHTVSTSPGTTRLWRQFVCVRIHSCFASR